MTQATKAALQAGMIPLRAALQYVPGIGNVDSLRVWLHRWNSAHPASPIERTHGTVNLADLLRARKKKEKP